MAVVSCAASSPVCCAAFLTRFTRLGTAVAGERLARECSSAIPTCGNFVAGSGGEHDGWLGSLVRCYLRLFAVLAVLRERLAGEHGGFSGSTACLSRGGLVGGGVLYAIERGSGGEAARSATATVPVTSATVIAASAIVSSTTITTIAAFGVLRCRFGHGVSGRNWSGVARSGLFGCAFEFNAGVVLVVILLFGTRGSGRLRLRVGTVDGLCAGIPLTGTATAAATTATPAAASIGAGSAFADLVLVARFGGEGVRVRAKVTLLVE